MAETKRLAGKGASVREVKKRKSKADILPSLGRMGRTGPGPLARGGGRGDGALVNYRSWKNEKKNFAVTGRRQT